MFFNLLPNRKAARRRQGRANHRSGGGPFFKKNLKVSISGEKVYKPGKRRRRLSPSSGRIPSRGTSHPRRPNGRRGGLGKKSFSTRWFPTYKSVSFTFFFRKTNLTVADEVKYGVFKPAPLDLLLYGERNSFPIKKNIIILKPCIPTPLAPSPPPPAWDTASP